uniref:Transmembrane protein n=1 Tax=Haemonchus contortus TaxID=6289 RepID=A0A7I5EBJ3_HAECO
MWYVGPTHLRCNQKNIYVVLGLCIVALVIYTFARERHNSFGEYQSCLLKRVVETGTVKFLSAIDEIVDQCTSQIRLDIRQHPQLDIDYIKLNTKEGSSRMIAKDHQLPRRTGEDSGYAARKGKPVSDQVKKAMRIEQIGLVKDMEREERKRSNGKANEENENEEGMAGSKHGPNEMEGEVNPARRSKRRAEEEFKDRKEDNRYELVNNHGDVDGENAREEGTEERNMEAERRHRSEEKKSKNGILITLPFFLIFFGSQ